jgi:probable addiction module antidote protein
MIRVVQYITREGRNPFDRWFEMPIKEHRASEYLKTPEDIAAYLNAVIEEMGDDPRLLMKAFRNVAESQGGVSKLAAKAELDRVALSRALSGRRNPRIDTLAKVSAACGVKLQFIA